MVFAGFLKPIPSNWTAVFLFSGNVFSQNLPYGLSVMLNHKATLITQTMVEDKDEVIKSPTQTTSYYYDYNFLSALDDYGFSKSGLKAAINPGLIRCSWDGASSVAAGVGNINASIYSRCELNLSLRWNDSITVSSPYYPPGTEVFVHFSHAMHANGSFNPFVSVWVDATFYSNFEQKTSEFKTRDTIDAYRVISLRTRIGDTITYNMGAAITGGAYTEVYRGSLSPEGSAASVEISLQGYGSNRMGIRSADTNVILTSASGYTYPGHAMSPTNVVARLENLVIKKVDYISSPGTATFFVDAIPGAKYVLQRSIGGNLTNWTDVGTPKTPLDFGELALTDVISVESSSFWRIAATALP